MKKLLLFLFITSFCFSQQSQEKYSKAKISYNTLLDLSRLDALGIPVDHGIQKKGFFIISDFSASEIQKTRNAGYQVDILIDDAKEYFLQQNRNPEPIRNPSCESNGNVDYTTPANFTLGSMGGYLTYQEILDQLDLMKTLYPNLITTKQNISNFLTEGTPDNSVTPSIGSNGIKWVKISDNPDANEGEPQILYTAIHHAREPISVSQLIFYMWYLLENYESNPEIQALVNNTELYFVPIVNPDGYLYNQKTDPNGGGFWRKNRHDTHGTDNNRNYDYYINGNPANNIWGGEGASSNPNDETYAGTSPFSEIENQAIRYFVENHDFVIALNNHTYGDLLLYPYGYTENLITPENELFIGISSELVSQNNLNNILSSELYPAAGDSDDFMYGTVGTHNKIYAMTPEIGPEFWPPSNQIIPLSKGMMYLNLTAAKMVSNYAVAKDDSPLYIGESTSVTEIFKLKRLGVSGSGNFTISIIPVSANIISVSGPVALDNLSLLEERQGEIQYTLASGIQPGEDIAFELVVNNGTYDTSYLISKKFGSLNTIFEDAGNSVTQNFTNDGWGISNTEFVSPSSSITDSPNGDYQNDDNKFISLTNSIDLTAAIGANVSFYAKWEIENNWDYVQFEISTDGGSNWIAQCGKYTNPGSSNGTQPEGEPLYDGNQNEWILEEMDLSDYIGENVLARFHFMSDGSQRGDGFYFDDLTFNVLNGTLGINTIEANQFTVYPNPVQAILNIKTNLQDYRTEIFNLQGQLISSTENNNGNQSADYSGFANGIYILRLTSAGTSQTFKIIKK